MKKQFTILLILIFILELSPINFITKEAKASNIPSPIAYWNFDNEGTINAGLITDIMGNYDAQVYHPHWTSNGYKGGGLIFDEQNDTYDDNKYGIETSNFPKRNNYTVLYRIKIGDMTNASSDRHIQSTPGSHSCGIKLYGDTPESPGSPNDINGIDINYIGYKPIGSSDNWYHFAFVFGEDGYYYYKDGVLNGYAPGYSQVQAGNFYFGYGGWGEKKATPIQLDEIKIYDTALTSNQIQEEFQYNELLCNEDVWQCDNWGFCQADGTKTRNCTITSDCAYSNTPSPDTTQSCTPECTINMWQCSEWGSCLQNKQQNRTCTKTSNCQGGISTPATSQSCTYTPVCTSNSWSCGSWSTCLSNGTQNRICNKTSNCEDGVTQPATTQSCNYAPPCNADIWTCGNWGDCSLSGIQNRSCTKTTDCPTTETAPPITIQYCEAPNKPQQTLPNESDEILNQNAIIKSTVKLLCPVDAYKASQGSGTIIDSSGTILTNKHVISGTLGCLVGFIDNFSDEPYFGERQIADIVKVSSNQDMAILKMRNPQNKKLAFVDITKGSSNLSLGTKVTTYGYPAKFGTKITYTSGDFSGSDGNYLKTTAILEYGNSGGGAYLKNGIFIGIPSAVVKGELNAMGYILSINTIKAWLGNSTIAYGNTNNTYSRVSVLEDIDLNKLGSLKLFIPDTDAKGDLVATPANQNSPKTTEQPQIIQQDEQQEESIIIESDSSDKNVIEQNTTSTTEDITPKMSWIKRFFSWLANLFNKLAE